MEACSKGWLVGSFDSESFGASLTLFLERIIGNIVILYDYLNCMRVCTSTSCTSHMLASYVCDISCGIAIHTHFFVYFNVNC